MFNLQISANDLKNLKAFLMRIDLKATEVAVFYSVFRALDAAVQEPLPEPAVTPEPSEKKNKKRRK